MAERSARLNGDHQAAQAIIVADEDVRAIYDFAGALPSHAVEDLWSLGVRRSSDTFFLSMLRVL